MDFFKLIEERQSVRKFKQKEIPDSDLEKILHAANRAPSAGNLQAYEIVAVKSPEIKKELNKAVYYEKNYFDSVPAILIFFANPEKSSSKYSDRGESLYSIQDATIACTYAQLAAQSLGISSVWIGAFEDEKVSAAVSAPENLIPVAVLPLGYAGEKPRITDRRSIDDLVKRENF